MVEGNLLSLRACSCMLSIKMFVCILFIFMLIRLFNFFSMVVKGVVCKKNVAHRRMTSKVDKPRLLILGGALEYQRVANHLSSFDTLLQQVLDPLLSFLFLLWF